MKLQAPGPGERFAAGGSEAFLALVPSSLWVSFVLLSASLRSSDPTRHLDVPSLLLGGVLWKTALF